MEFTDYLKQCLQDVEFREYWIADFPDFDFNDIEIKESITLNLLDIREALEELSKDDLEQIIQNKGIEKTVNIRTRIIFFDRNGKCPVKDFLEDIPDKKLKEKTLKNIYQLALSGKNVRQPLSKYVDDGIFELRTKQSTNLTRVFYFFIYGDEIILTNGYIKKDQKLDVKEFQKAKMYMKIYLTKKKIIV